MICSLTPLCLSLFMWKIMIKMVDLLIEKEGGRGPDYVHTIVHEPLLPEFQPWNDPLIDSDNLISNLLIPMLTDILLSHCHKGQYGQVPSEVQL